MGEGAVRVDPVARVFDLEVPGDIWQIITLGFWFNHRLSHANVIFEVTNIGSSRAGAERTHPLLPYFESGGQITEPQSCF